jgi:hypothetical protein
MKVPFPGREPWQLGGSSRASGAARARSSWYTAWCLADWTCILCAPRAPGGRDMEALKSYITEKAKTQLELTTA